MNSSEATFLRSIPAPQLIFGFTLAFTAFDLIPIAFSDADAFKGLTWGDIVDAPVVLLPLAFLGLMTLDGGLWRDAYLRIGVLLALVLFTQGHAIHLAANAISHHLGTSHPAWESAYFLDENVGHYQIHLALLALAAMFIWAARTSATALEVSPTLVLSVAIYGPLQAAGAIEGQTVPLVLPASLLLAAAAVRLAAWRVSPYAAFFAASYAICFVVLVAYGAVNGGWPEIL
jgi:hypothetical protein